MQLFQTFWDYFIVSECPVVKLKFTYTYLSCASDVHSKSFFSKMSSWTEDDLCWINPAIHLVQCPASHNGHLVALEGQYAGQKGQTPPLVLPPGTWVSEFTTSEDGSSLYTSWLGLFSMHISKVLLRSYMFLANSNSKFSYFCVCHMVTKFYTI